MKLFPSKLSCFHIRYFLQIALEYWGISRKENIDPAIIQSKKFSYHWKGIIEAIAKRYQWNGTLMSLPHCPCSSYCILCKNFGGIMLLWIWHPLGCRDQSYCLSMNLLFLNSHNHTGIYQEEQSLEGKY